LRNEFNLILNLNKFLCCNILKLNDYNAMFVRNKDAQVACGRGEGLPLVCKDKKNEKPRKHAGSVFFVPMRCKPAISRIKARSDIARANTLYSEYFPRELGN
jgi:hypothetical protein